MTPREFFDVVVALDADEFRARPGDLRAAYHAVTSADAAFAHIFNWLKSNRPEQLTARDDLHFREQQAAADPQIAILRDLAKAQKHVELVRGNPTVRRADSVGVADGAWAEAWGDSWGQTWGKGRIIVVLDDATYAPVLEVVQHARVVIEALLDTHGM